MFSKKPDDFPSAAAPKMAKPMAGGSTFSVIGSDVTITGNISASVDLHVDGRIEGDIECSNLVQGEGSEINGAVVAESARLAGRVKGSVVSRELVILKSAQIEGDVNYDTLTVEQGAQIEGRFGARKAQPGARPAAQSPKVDDDQAHLTLAS